MPVRGLAGCPFGFEVFGSSGRMLGYKGAVGGHRPQFLGHTPIGTLLKLVLNTEKSDLGYIFLFARKSQCNHLFDNCWLYLCQLKSKSPLKIKIDKVETSCIAIIELNVTPRFGKQNI